MYRIKILNFEKKYLLDELIKIFLRPDQYVLIEEEDQDVDLVFNEENFSDKQSIYRQIYDQLSAATGKKAGMGNSNWNQTGKALWGALRKKNQDVKKNAGYFNI